MDDVMDGILYGFIIGVGFSFMENWGYYTFYSPFEIGLVPWLSLVGLRIFGSGLLHGVFTGITGGIVGIIRKNNLPGDDKYLPFAVIPAIIIHMIYNTITNLGVLLQVSGEVVIGILVVFIIFLIWVFSKVIKRAMKYKKGKPFKFTGDD
jgi:RsiW-degrading membrane proteinase PrsW (M82 family)